MKVAKGYSVKGYSKADIKAVQRGSAWGKPDQARYDALIASRSKAKSKASSRSSSPAPRSTSSSQPAPQAPPQPAPKPKPQVEQYLKPKYKYPNQSPNANSSATSNQTQTVTQDNDINTNINGDYNTVVSNQDNSIRQYGGNTKSFTYNGGKGMSSLYDSPVSAGTMGGFFHEEDSPASNASFMDRYMTMNRDMQKQYMNTGISDIAIGKARNSKAINTENLDNRIDARAKASRARSTKMAGDIFGDMFNYKPVDFKAPESPEAIKQPTYK